MRKFSWPSVLLALSLFYAVSAQASPEAEIRQALIQWTDDFNAGRVDPVCALFAPDLIANIKGASERDHAALSDWLRTALANPKVSYRYTLDIHEILVSGDLAFVRLTWTLQVKDKGTEKLLETSVEPGLDVFRRDHGRWRIARYMSYQEDGAKLP